MIFDNTYIKFRMFPHKKNDADDITDINHGVI